jgi:uncharacterized membrane protein YGL010W
MALGFNLRDQLAFYGAYHHNKWNQLIHFIFVPAIMWSALVWLAYSGPVVPLDLPQHLHRLPPVIARAAVPNLAAILVALYWAYYVTLEVFAGLMWGLFIGVPLWLTATAFQAAVPYAWAWALGAHVFSWYMQIHLGHLVLEGRKPALLDSLFQSFALAPLFVWLELLFALGYRKGLQAELNERITKDLSAFKAAKAPLLSSDAQPDAVAGSK